MLESSNDPNARALFEQFATGNAETLTGALSSLDPATASAVIDTVNNVMVTQLRSWALGRSSIRDVERKVDRAIDLIFSAPPA
jgi:hypothetical protein